MSPLTAKGIKVRKKLHSFYGKEKGEKIFYALIQEGKLTGAEGKVKRKKKKKK